MKHCSQCGSKLKRDSKFCHDCGSKLVSSNNEESKANIKKLPDISKIYNYSLIVTAILVGIFILKPFNLMFQRILFHVLLVYFSSSFIYQYFLKTNFKEKIRYYVGLITYIIFYICWAFIYPQVYPNNSDKNLALFGIIFILMYFLVSIKKGEITNVEPSKEITTFSKPVVIYISCFTIFVLCAFTIFVPTKTYYYNVEVPYEDSETYYEKEPYDAQESYQVQVPYESTETYYDTVPTQVSVPYTDYEENVYQAPPGQYYPTVTSPCRCTDYNFWNNCIEETCTNPVTKYRTETQQQTVGKTRPVTKYRTETQYRTVTKYNEVQKTRTVIKMKDEPRQYEVNWLFNFKVPWYLHVPYMSYQP